MQGIISNWEEKVYIRRTLSHRLKVNSEIDILENQKVMAFNFDSSDFNNTLFNNLNFKLTPSQDEVIKLSKMILEEAIEATYSRRCWLW